MYLIGFDIGSSSIKTALLRADTQEVVKLIHYPDQDMDMISRQIGWAEQQPEAWWQYLCISTRKILAETRIDPKDIKGIGIAYQMHGLVLVDEEKEVLRPSIIWCDSRAGSIGRRAFEDLGEEHCLSTYLNSPGNFTASKMKWVMDNEPDIYERVHKMMLPGDYINMKFTGTINTTISGLSEAILWDYQKKEPAEEILDFFGIQKSLIPNRTPTFSISGLVSRHASIQTGLCEGTPVTYRAGDQPNNALSLNVVNTGEVAATSGTSGVVYGLVNKPIYDPLSRVNAFTHVNYEEHFDRIGVLLCINGAGIQYSWIKQQVARSDSSYADMDRMASSVPIGSEGICILPFGNGSERIFQDRNLGSHIFNLRFNRHTRAHMYRASLEGVAYAFVHGMQILMDMGLSVDVIRVGNDNMFQSGIFSRTIATLLQSEIEVVETTGAIGAARAAGIACGIYSDLKEALSGINPTKLYEPDMDFAQCAQSYSYWRSSLDRVLQTGREDLKQHPASAVKGMLEKELRNKNFRLTTQSLELSNQNRLLQQLEVKLKSLSEVATLDDAKTKLQDIQRQLGKSIREQASFEDFQEYYDEMNDEFVAKLSVLSPGLSAEDVKLCAYLRLKMRTKDIASKMNLSIRGVETKRYRLRKKLNLSPSVKLIDFLTAV